MDTNILVYAHGLTQGAKHERARALVQSLWESENGVVSTQVLQELCVSLRWKVVAGEQCSGLVSVPRFACPRHEASAINAIYKWY